MNADTTLTTGRVRLQLNSNINSFAGQIRVSYSGARFIRYVGNVGAPRTKCVVNIYD